jgi:hypothetical protein
MSPQRRALGRGFEPATSGPSVTAKGGKGEAMADDPVAIILVRYYEGAVPRRSR